jgi:hypothetical protein
VLISSLACASFAGIAPRTPWGRIFKVTDSTSNEQPSLWVVGGTPLIAWPGAPGQPNIRLANGTNPPVVLPLGTIPHDLSLYPASQGLLHVLWLDQIQPGETRLAEAIITTEGKVERNANAVSTKQTTHYAAVMLANGNVLTLWSEAAQRSALYAQLVDGEGRPHPAVRLSNDARNPSGMLDLNGKLHLAWLESERAQTWTIRYLSFDNGKLPDTDNPSSIPIGVIQLAANSTLESFGLGVDAAHVYCLWGTISLNNIGEPVGKLAGLSFPFGDNTAVQPVNFDALNAQSVRWLSMPPRAAQSLNVGLIASSRDEQGRHDTPMSVSITTDSVVSHPVFEGATDVIGKTALVTDLAGKLYLAWTVLRPDGTTAIYYASTG